MRINDKLLIVFSFIAVFIIGVLGGVLLEKYFLNKKPSFMSLEDMAQELNLTSNQEQKIREIFKNNDPKFKNLRSDFYELLKKMRSQLNNEIISVLNENQSIKFEAMIEKHISQMKKERKKRNKYPHDRENEKGEKK